MNDPSHQPGIVIEFLWLAGHPKTGITPPAYATEGSAGMDIQAAVAKKVVIAPGEIALIPTGFAVAIPSGYELQIRPRSGLALRHGITLINSPGTIDSDYRGEVKIPLINHGKEDFTVCCGDRIAQMVLGRPPQIQIKLVDSLAATGRQGGGFGHTGV